MEGQKHTAGTVALAPHSRTSVVAGKRLVASCGGYTSNVPGEDAHSENEANARRLVACWNACLGIPTEQLEAGAVGVNPTPALDVSEAVDYEEVLADHRRLVRELDVALNGENAAQQASLCDIVGQVKHEGIKARQPQQPDEPDYKELAHDMADAIGKMLLRLKATSDWMGTLRNRETGENYTWEEMFARLIERIPGLEVDRRYFEAKGLPAKQRRARYWELDQEMAAKRKAAALPAAPKQEG